MWETKNSKRVIMLLVVFIILLSILCILFTMKIIDFKFNNKTNQNINDSNIVESGNIDNNVDDDGENDNYIEFVIDNEKKVNLCHNMNKNNYYSYEKNYAVIVNNIFIKNNTYTFKYEENLTNRATRVYLNNNLVFSGNMSEALLVDVCNYGDYLVYSTGWEGPLFYRIMNTKGDVVMSFLGLKVTYFDGILSVEELNKNNIEDYNDNEWC